MKTFNKTIGKMFKHNIGRFVANVLIVLFSIALIGGLGVLPYSFVDSFLVTYKEGNCPDIINDIILNFEAHYQQKYSGLQWMKVTLSNRSILYKTAFYSIFVPYLNIISTIGLSIYEIIFLNTNKQRINDLFKPIRDEVEKFKKESILNFEKSKNKFFSKLNDIQDISEKEIKFLNDNKFRNKFNKFIN